MEYRETAEMCEFLATYAGSEAIGAGIGKIAGLVRFADIAQRTYIESRMTIFFNGLCARGIEERQWDTLRRYCENPTHAVYFSGMVRRIINTQSDTCAMLLSVIVAESVKKKRVLDVVEWKVCDALQHLCDADVCVFRKSVSIAKESGSEEITEDAISRCSKSLEIEKEYVLCSLQSCMLYGLFTKDTLGTLNIENGGIMHSVEEYDKRYMLNPLSEYLYSAIESMPLKQRTI